MGTGWFFSILMGCCCCCAEKGFQFPEYFCSSHFACCCRGNAFCSPVQRRFAAKAPGERATRRVLTICSSKGIFWIFILWTPAAWAEAPKTTSYQISMRHNITAGRTTMGCEAPSDGCA